MKLLPCLIRYSQDSISNTFSDGDLIGEILDDICEGRMKKRDFPRIKVAKIDGKWYTANNRRLWVFRKLEELAMCRKVRVEIIDEIPRCNMTTTNEGKDVKVRGRPGGIWIKELESDSNLDSSNEELHDEFGKARI